jgi:hypothetical protein
VEVSAPTRLREAGATLVSRYDGFAIVELAPSALAAVPEAEPLADENRILLNAGALDTSTPEVKALQRPRGQFEGNAMQLVQFAGPVRPEWYEKLAATGVQIVTYIPTNAYLVYGSAKQVAAVEAFAAADPSVQWTGAYLNQYRIDPAADALAHNPKTQSSTNQYFAIQMVYDPAANAQTLAVIGGLATGPATRSERSLGTYYNVIVPMAPSNIAKVAAQNDVVSIQPYIIPELFDERQDQIVAGNLSGNVPSGVGYLNWLASKGFTQAQFSASSFSVDVSDSGIDNGTTSPNHFGLYSGGIRPGTSRIIYNRLVGTPHSGSTLQGCDGHGNLNTHIVLGYNSGVGAPQTDAAGYHYGLGVCPFATAGSSVIFDPSTFTSPNYANLQSMAYNNGARISTNSWGASTFGIYNSDSQSYDALVRDAQPAGSTFPTAGNQEMVIVFAAGNSGSGASSVGTPGTGKNIFTIGASEGVQAFGGADGCGETDAMADSANDIAAFSGRGPCTDGRKKPDLMAPGTHISGGVAQTASPAPTGTANPCYVGSGVCGGVSSIYFPSAGQQLWTASSGTSHSTPCVAGGCALLRQFFINNSLTPPSPAMTKAFLMNSARYMNGSGANDTLYSNNQGMGMMNLGDAFNRVAVTPTILRDELAADMFTASGQTRVVTGNVADSTKPFRITLAWTDAPGATSGAAYKNNLDLTVTVGGNTYRGNVFSGANSVTGGVADAANNVESVFLPAGVSGPFTVTVTATNINSDGVPGNASALDQDYALVVYNATTVAANNNCANAIPVSNGATPFDTTGATTDGPTESQCSFCCGDLQINQDIWFTYTATCASTDFSLCGSSYDTKIAIYAGGTCPSSPNTAIACNDDACGTTGLNSDVNIPTIAGQTYLIRVGGYSTNAGPGTLTITPGTGLNDSCSNAFVIGPGTYFGSTSCSTNDGQPSCGLSTTTGDVWYSFTAPGPGRLTVDTCGSTYDTVLSLHSGCPGTTANEITCDDDAGANGTCPNTLQSWISAQVVGGNTYLIRVAGYNTITGNYQLNVAFASCYPNCDNSTTPPVLNVLDFSCFINKYAAGDPYANCDGSTTPPVLNVLDFACFLNRYAAGCP